MKTITTAQRELLHSLDDGWEVTFKDEHYATVKDGLDGAKLWPSTFYGLFDSRMVERIDNGNYTISYYGQEQIRGEVPGMVEAPTVAKETILEKEATT